MIEDIYLSDVVDRVTPAEKVIKLAVVGQVVYIGMYKSDETSTEHQYKLIEQAPDIDEKDALRAKSIRAQIAVDLGDFIQAVALLNESQDRLSKRVQVEEKQRQTRTKSIEVELAEQTAQGANQRFTDLYKRHEELQAEAKVLREETERAQTELRGTKWKLAEELHRQGRGPAPEPEESVDA